MTIIDRARRSLQRTPRIRRVAKTLLAPLRSFFDMKAVENYNRWLDTHLPSQAELNKQVKRAQTFTHRPLISILVPVYDPPQLYFDEMLDSVFSQTYDNWELILVDDASPSESVRETIQRVAAKDKRIKFVFNEKNQHISGASNTGLGIAQGKFVALLDNDDILQPNALYEVAESLNKNPKLDFIYSDEDKISASNKRHNSPYFKPDWNPDFLYSVNYITHLAVIRKSLLNEAGRFNGKYDGAQDWELFLRLARKIDGHRIHHIPKILYSWRVHEMSTASSIEAKPYVVDAQRRAIQSDLNARNTTPYQLSQDPVYPAQWRLDFKLKDQTGVDIIMLSELNKNPKSVIERLKAQYTIIVPTEPIEYLSGSIQELVADAQRNDIGFVVARSMKKPEVMNNIRKLINPQAIPLVETMGERDITKHFYSTTRYDLPFIDSTSVVCIGTDKLRAIAKQLNTHSLEDLSREASKEGYRNLYNPYVSWDVL